MFGNWLNRHDAAALLTRVVERGSDLRTFFRGRDERIKRHWDQTLASADEAFEPLARRANALVTGDPCVSRFEYGCRKYLAGGNALACSLGCGSGEHELSWARQGAFARIEGYDISPERIEVARRKATDEALDRICRFHCCDLAQVPLADGRYDVVLFESALHHFTPLRRVLEATRRALKPGGLVFLYDFVGPTKFQWLPRQLEVVNGLLDLLPERYRRLQDGRVLKRHYRPSLLRMWLSDPSEAVESAAILPLLDELFDRRELTNAGGAILYHLFPRLIHNFPGNDPEAQRWLQLCIETEDLWLARTDEIGWWYAFGVYQKRD